MEIGFSMDPVPLQRSDSLRRKVSRGMLDSPSNEDFCITVDQGNSHGYQGERYTGGKPTGRLKQLVTMLFTLTAIFTIGWAASMCYQVHVDNLNRAESVLDLQAQQVRADKAGPGVPTQTVAEIEAALPRSDPGQAAAAASMDAGRAHGQDTVVANEVRAAAQRETDAETQREEQDVRLTTEIMTLEQRIRDMKAGGIVIARDARAKVLTGQLQVLAREVTELRFGVGPYFVEMELELPDIMVKPGTSKSQYILMETGPLEHIPYSVYMWLDVVRMFKSGAFHRNAGHVLQALVRKNRKAMAFQEYSPNFPHKQYTMGYAGRPGGPAFYISIEDNVHNHGPGSQGSETEADGCFARLADQSSIDVAKLMHTQPGAGGSGFVSPRSNWIEITGMKVIPRPTSKGIRGA